MASISAGSNVEEKSFKFGTKEWAETNVNCITGCHRDCRYCYAKGIAIRFKQLTANNWSKMKIREKAVKKNYLKRDGRIMFPTSHDIVPDQPYFDACLIVLEKMLKSKNEVLITTKPNFVVVKEICDKFTIYKDLILFRFTIGAIKKETIQFWEPNAPLFGERLKALKYAFNKDFKTSVSIEPFLEAKPSLIVEQVEEYVNETIWIGLMNHIPRKNIPDELKPYYQKIREYYKFENVNEIYQKLNLNPKIRWKESIKKLMLKNLISKT